MQDIPVFQHIAAYNKAINLSPPNHSGFDVRRFEDNMKVVPAAMPMFRHNFFQIALLHSGDGSVQRDEAVEDFENYTLFMTVPGQLIGWNIRRNWKGMYVSFHDDYILLKRQNLNFLKRFPFLRRNVSESLTLSSEEAASTFEVFEKLYREQQSPEGESRPIIESYLNILLEYTRRFYESYGEQKQSDSTDSALTERFKMVLEELVRAHALGIGDQRKSVSEIAEQLFVTPNHLSETLKKETGFTALELIHNSLLQLARQLLTSTDLTITEISYQLGFENPPYFSRLFRKKVGMTPGAFRKAALQK